MKLPSLKRSLVLLLVLCLIFVSCYHYVPDLYELSPEEVIFEFNRILNRVKELEYFKGILHVTRDEARKDAGKIVDLLILYRSKSPNVKPVISEIEKIIEYLVRVSIVIIDLEYSGNNDNEVTANVSYYDSLTHISDLKQIKLIRSKKVWKISQIIDLEDVNLN